MSILSKITRLFRRETRAERDARDYKRGYIAGRNFIKGRPDKIIWARVAAWAGMDAYDHGWDAGVVDGVSVYKLQIWRYK